MTIMRATVPSGQTSWIQYIYVEDTSFAPVTGLSYIGNTAWYVRDKAAPVEIALAAVTVTGVFTSGGFVEVDGTNMPGVYRFDIPNAVFAYGVNNAIVNFRTGTSQDFILYIQLDPPANVTQIVGNTTAGPNLKDFAVNGYDATNHRAYADVMAVNGTATVAASFATWLGQMATGTAQSGSTSTTIKLASGASSANRSYVHQMAIITSGTGSGQVRPILDYVGSTRVATITPAWVTTPDNTSVYLILPIASAVNAVAIDTDPTAAEGVAGMGSDYSVDGMMDANVKAISDDTVAADNAEKVFDNTGYNMSASAIGTATAVTNTVAADVVSISGDVAAADNAEKVFDNTGYNMSNSTLGTVTAVTTVTTVATVTNVTNGVGLSAAAVDAIWDESLTAHTTVNTPGAAMNGIEGGAATATTLSTTQMSTNLSIAVNDHYKDRVLIWISGSLKRQAVSITAYNGATKTLTFTAATSAPSNGDKFIIV